MWNDVWFGVRTPLSCRFGTRAMATPDHSAVAGETYRLSSQLRVSARVRRSALSGSVFSSGLAVRTAFRLDSRSTSAPARLRNSGCRSAGSTPPVRRMSLRTAPVSCHSGQRRRFPPLPRSNATRTVQFQVARAPVRNLLHPRPGVVHRQQQGMVSTPGRSRGLPARPESRWTPGDRPCALRRA